MSKSKKIISLVAAATLTFSALALSGCGTQDYKGEKLSAGYVSSATVSSNGGFVVEKGNYVYFINGQQNNSADNAYGTPVKGSLVRISKTELAAGNYDEAQIVVPSLFVTGSYDSGIYIYGDYVYYATPTTDKDKDGNVANTSLDFKRAKIDGTAAPMDGKNEYFFRLTSNTTKYRYVEENSTVYCLYEQDGQLKSYNTKTGDTTVLVKGAGTIYYDTQNLDNPNVYYTMSVSQGVDEENVTSKDYNQIFTVNAAASVSVDASKAEYAAKDEDGNVVAKYDFNENNLKEENEEAKENDEDEPYNLSDYTTYPYVNLGELVLDGIGNRSAIPGHRTDLTEEQKVAATEPFGYTYTIQGYKDGGLYFTRKSVQTALGNDPTYLHYLSDTRTDWNAVIGNKTVDTVSKETTKASSSAIYLKPAEGKHTFFYSADSAIYRVKTENGEITEEVKIAKDLASESTLWKVDGNYLYYYGTGTNGKNISRINYTGDEAKYKFLDKNVEYDPVTLPLVDFSDSWYKPEFVTVGEGATAKQILLYANAQSYGAGSTAYNNIYLATVDSNEQIEKANEEIAAINEEIDSYDTNGALQNLMKYYFRRGNTTQYEAVKDLYDSYQKAEFAKFVEKFGENKEFASQWESKYISAVGKVNEDDEEAIEEAWRTYLKYEEEEEEDDGLPLWAIIVIVSSVAVVIVVAALIWMLTYKKKLDEKARAEEQIVNAYKHKKIDTTDDKSIDVYSVDEEETLVEEAVNEEESGEESTVADDDGEQPSEE